MTGEQIIAENKEFSPCIFDRPGKLSPKHRVHECGTRIPVETHRWPNANIMSETSFLA
jgi:hypothetical protein